MVLENVDYQLRSDVKCGFTEALSLWFNSSHLCLSRAPKLCLGELWLGSKPSYLSPVQRSRHAAHPLQELWKEQPASPKMGSQIGSAACSAELDLKMCLSKFCGDLGLCGEISVADVSGSQQLSSAICSLTRCLFNRDFLEGGLWF